jgi:hypothetical protein
MAISHRQNRLTPHRRQLLLTTHGGFVGRDARRAGRALIPSAYQDLHCCEYLVIRLCLVHGSRAPSVSQQSTGVTSGSVDARTDRRGGDVVRPARRPDAGADAVGAAQRRVGRGHPCCRRGLPTYGSESAPVQASVRRPCCRPASGAAGRVSTAGRACARVAERGVVPSRPPRQRRPHARLAISPGPAGDPLGERSDP